MRNNATSGLAAAILEIGRRSMSHDVVDELFELSDLEK
jgi:hypothetical protein